MSGTGSREITRAMRRDSENTREKLMVCGDDDRLSSIETCTDIKIDLTGEITGCIGDPNNGEKGWETMWHEAINTLNPAAVWLRESGESASNEQIRRVVGFRHKLKIEVRGALGTRHVRSTYELMTRY